MITSVIITLLVQIVFSINQTEYEECYNFLIDNMPERDVGNIPEPVLNETITYALLTRQNVFPFNKYTKNIPWDIFKNYVVPFYTLSEARDNSRKYFYNVLYPLIVQNMNTFNNRSDIVLWTINNVNSIFNKSFKFVSNQEPMILSPFEVLSYQYASCTGYSLFFTAIYRSIGIPARVVGTPHWNETCVGGGCTGPIHCNHDWVEIYDNNGYWSFTDAFPEGYTYMNYTWFYGKDTNCQTANSGNYSIYASSYAPTNNRTHFIMEWDYGATYVPGWDVTNNYHTNKSASSE